MTFMPHWLIRVLITLAIIWLIWALVIRPWLFSTETFLKAHYWWMFPYPG